MKKTGQYWIFGAIIMVILIAVPLVLFIPGNKTYAIKDPWKSITKKHSHLSHAAFFQEEMSTGQEVTRKCLECHKDAAHDMMKTAHWKWESDEVKIADHSKPQKIGKKNLLNNFCLGITGNWKSCTSCHAGYGWKDNSFDFNAQENVDCLICHDWSGTYAKGNYGFPKKEVNLKIVAQSVGYPKRDNCGTCHNYGGGGLGVKHGDLDNTLLNPTPDMDVHMGKLNLLCIDCHKTEKHNITGKAYSVSVNHDNGIGCTNCHDEIPHKDKRLNSHLASVACQTCHIPSFAKRVPTKTDWDWSKAGDPTRTEDTHHYLKIKGEFIYNQDITPHYEWFNLNVKRYLLGDKINPSEITYLNKPIGDISDKTAKIWPFKLHHAKQPYDTVNNILLIPVTSGPGGFWTEFNWDKALRLGAGLTGVNYSGNYGFAETEMHWPLSHMIAPKTDALKCNDCHGENSRMDWKALGYPGDPIKTGGRNEN